MSRELTTEEVRGRFIAQVQLLVDYWARQPEMTTLERCEGVAFSIMNVIDGTSPLPGFDLVVRPHPDDAAYLASIGEDYYPDGATVNDCMLHELILKKS